MNGGPFRRSGAAAKQLLRRLEVGIEVVVVARVVRLNVLDSAPDRVVGIDVGLVVGEAVVEQFLDTIRRERELLEGRVDWREDHVTALRDASHVGIDNRRADANLWPV